MAGDVGIDRDGEPWWVLADVCGVLELTNPSMAAKALDEDEKGTLNTIEGGPDRILISEPGLYKLIQTSRKPAAKRFDRWVRHEVLPAHLAIGPLHGAVLPKPKAIIPYLRHWPGRDFP